VKESVPDYEKHTLAWAYLQLRGLDQVRILDAGYEALAAELKPGRVYKRTRR
jgi:hypothetical protein